MTPLIVFDSPDYACFHEAGHAELAIYLDAPVKEIQLYRESERSYGRTRIDRTEHQRRRIALGGFSAEYTLFRAKRLRKSDGTEPSELEFIQYGLANARDDLEAFYGDAIEEFGDAELKTVHNDFMKFAIGYADDHMRFKLVENIAEALLMADYLGESDVDRIHREFVAEITAVPSTNEKHRS
jgi:hypothetical protein